MGVYQVGGCHICGLPVVLFAFLFFFFSSRRRHTRLQGDWSSDVCSSDLVALSPQRRHRINPGEFFGEMSLLDGEPRSATVKAETDLRLLVIDRTHFWRLLRSEEHTSELQSPCNLVCRLLLEKKKKSASA